MKCNSHLQIETKRLLLRPLEEKDAFDYYRYIVSDKEVLQYFVARYEESFEGFSLKKMIESFQKDNRLILAICNKENNEFMGIILQCSAESAIFHTSEVGYALGKKFWNKGYASEALIGFIDYLFCQGLHKVTACHILENSASKRVMEKANMKYEGRKIDEIYYHDCYWDCDYYYLINDKNEASI